MTKTVQRADAFLFMRRTGARAELCLDDKHDIVVSVPSKRTGVRRIVGYLTFSEWIEPEEAEGRMHLVATMVQTFLETEGEDA